MTRYTVQNRWGGPSASWNDAGVWMIGSRPDQSVIEITFTSSDGGATLTGSMTYSGEGPIGFRGTRRNDTNSYEVENQWGGNSAPWNAVGEFVIGSRTGQSVVEMRVSSVDGGSTLTGTMTYVGEGPIDFNGTKDGYDSYNVENQWGGSGAPWNKAGIWGLGDRKNQAVISMDISSADSGNTLEGSVQYQGEGPITFRGMLRSGNNYSVEYQWGGSGAPWNKAGDWLIGDRSTQKIVALKASSDDGKVLVGTCTYDGEGPVGLKGTVIS